MPKSEVRVLNGYRVIYEPDHPSSMTNENWKGYVYEHIKVAEDSIGRLLRDNEVVHHLDGSRKNNRVENLLVLERSQHSKLHVWLDTGVPWSKDQGENGMNSGKSKVTEPNFCLCCDRTLQYKQIKYCSDSCAKEGQRKVKNRPSKVELSKLLSTMSKEAIGRNFGVSGNAVKKWAKQYELL